MSDTINLRLEGQLRAMQAAIRGLIKASPDMLNSAMMVEKEINALNVSGPYGQMPEELRQGIDEAKSRISPTKGDFGNAR